MENELTASVQTPGDAKEFWEKVRFIIQEEILKEKSKTIPPSLYQTNGLTCKPVFKIAEVCKLLQITRPTIYDWIRLGKLEPYKIQSRVYFLWEDIRKAFTQDSKE